MALKVLSNLEHMSIIVGQEEHDNSQDTDTLSNMHLFPDTDTFSDIHIFLDVTLKNDPSINENMELLIWFIEEQAFIVLEVINLRTLNIIHKCN